MHTLKAWVHLGACILLCAPVLFRAQAQDTRKPDALPGCGLEIPAADNPNIFIDGRPVDGNDFRSVVKSINQVCQQLHFLASNPVPDSGELQKLEGQIGALQSQVNTLQIRPGNTADPHLGTLVQDMQAMLAAEVSASNSIGQRLKAAAPVKVYIQAAPKAGDSAAQVRPQIDPHMPVQRYYPDASHIEFVMATIPDPRVPRLRREYDNTIVAISQGMLDNDYVLDRYGFPWSDTLRSPREESRDDEAVSFADDGQFGVLLYRHDAWRETGAAGVPVKAHPAEVRAVYLIPETSTYGVAANSLRCAARLISLQLPPVSDNATIADAIGPCIAAGEQSAFDAAAQFIDMARGYPSPAPLPVEEVLSSVKAGKTRNQAASGDTGAAAAAGTRIGLYTSPPPRDGQDAALSTHSLCSAAGSLVMLGPEFSSSLDSIREIAASLDYPRLRFNGLCLVSGSITSTSNERVIAQSAGKLDLHSLAVSDRNKLAALEKLKLALQVQPTEVVFLLENSVFGRGICASTGGPEPEVCKEAYELYFPANIADVRYGEQKRQAELDRKNAMLPKSQNAVLALQSGAENGSEFPESHQSPLTASSAELELRDAIGTMSRMDVRIVVVAATDVRDRLFLSDRISQIMPNVLLVDLEADNLLSHPDFIHATRGTVVYASAVVAPHYYEKVAAGCEQGKIADAFGRHQLQSWASDKQELLAKAATLLDASSACNPKPEATPAIHIVTRIGLRPLGTSDPASLHRLTDPFPHRALWFWVVIAVLSLAATATWYFQASLQSSLPWARRWHRSSTWGATVANPALLSTLALALLLGAGSVPTLAMLFSASVIFLWLLAGCYRRYGRAAAGTRGIPTRMHGVLQQRPVQWWIGAFLLTSLALTACAVWTALKCGAAFDIDKATINRLGLQAPGGVAYHLATGLAVLLLVYSALALATVREANRRNAYILHAAVWDVARLNVHAKLRRLMAAYCGFLGNTRWLLLLSGVAALLALLPFVPCVGEQMPPVMRQFGRATIFGVAASWSSFLAVLASTIAGIVWLIAALAAAWRILALSSMLASRVAAVRPLLPAAGGKEKGAHEEDDADGDQDVLGYWNRSDEATPLLFPPTPFAVHLQDGDGAVQELLEPPGLVRWIQGIREVLDSGANQTHHRLCMFALLASEMTQFRWSSFAAALCALCVVAEIYLFPVFNGDNFLLANLALLLAAGLTTGMFAVVFERNGPLSNILCNCSHKIKLSKSLVGTITLPFLLLLLASAMAMVPGVRQWGGGTIQPLLGIFGVHASE